MADALENRLAYLDYREKKTEDAVKDSRAEEITSAAFMGAAIAGSILMPFPLAIVGVPAALYFGNKSLKAYEARQKNTVDLKEIRTEQREDMQAIRAMAIAQYRGEEQTQGNNRDWGQTVRGAGQNADRTI